MRSAVADPRTDWPGLFLLFEQLADLPTGERGAALDELAAGNPQLKQRLAHLLALDESRDTLIEDVADWRLRLAHESLEAMPENLGPWRIVRVLGEGGMGRVFLAERADGQYEQRCALKLIRGEFVSDRALAKFVRERRILARLNHPGIAQLFDGGIDARGRPWFAMRYIEGASLTAYCRERQLNLEDRLRLMIAISHTVAYAHRQFVLHCDLKPSNILIDADGEPQLVDFGIARLLEGHDMNDAGTHSAANAMSPGYSAPEQIGGATLTVASDVYSLGAVLYEMLSGRRPYAGSDATQAAVAVAHAQGEPRPPSQHGAVAPVSRTRLRGDLDLIVGTALRHDPAMRYPSAEALASDLERYLRGAPLSARADDRAYRLRKFVHRHWLGLGMLAALVASLTLGIVGIEYEYGRVQAEAGVASAVKNFLVDVLSESEPDRHPGRETSARELLDAGAEQLRKDDGISDPIRAELSAALSRSYAALGSDDQAEQLARRVVELDRSAYGEHAAQTAKARVSLADILVERERVTAPGGVELRNEAESLSRLALADLGGVPSAPAVHAHLILARLRAHGIDLARHEAETAVSIAAQLPADESIWLGRADYALALARLESGDAAQAAAAARQAVDMLGKSRAGSGKEARKARSLYATLLMHVGRTREAAEEWKALLASQKEVFGAKSPAVADTMMSYAMALGNGGEGAAAQSVAFDAVAMARELDLPAAKLRGKLHALGDIAALRGDFATARDALAEAVQMSEGIAPNKAPPALLLRWHQLRTVRGEPGVLGEYERFIAGLDDSSRSTRMAEVNVGAGHLALGQPERAVERYASVGERAGTGGIESRDLRTLAALGIATARLQQQEYAKAGEQINRVDSAQLDPGSFLIESLSLLKHIVAVRSGRCGDSESALDALASERAKTFGEDSVWTAEVRLAHAETLQNCRHDDSAAQEERDRARGVLARMLDPAHIELRSNLAYPSPSAFW
jgi:serine/threonine-protein kinase